eukprot:TRINITY_DN2284_c1_g1_i1.p1 TRINITY_DN2284_c1_g1~~TRINITY_DN2284_c1_g1_i1.p1  ORF type:complete len:318 (+),score=22.40 TRINITY_DN2284_c1_g1_i1:220-1173(+)
MKRSSVSTGTSGCKFTIRELTVVFVLVFGFWHLSVLIGSRRGGVGVTKPPEGVKHEVSAEFIGQVPDAVGRGNVVYSRLCSKFELTSQWAAEYFSKLKMTPAQHFAVFAPLATLHTINNLGLLTGQSPPTVFILHSEWNIPTYLAASGCNVTVGYPPPGPVTPSNWAWNLGSVPPQVEKSFGERLTYRPTDPFLLPLDLRRSFDLIWSAGHVDYENGERHINKVLRCLRPKGIAIFTFMVELSQFRHPRYTTPGAVRKWMSGLQESYKVYPLSFTLEPSHTTYLPPMTDTESYLSFKSPIFFGAYASTSFILIVQAP